MLTTAWCLLLHGAYYCMVLTTVWCLLLHGAYYGMVRRSTASITGIRSNYIPQESTHLGLPWMFSFHLANHETLLSEITSFHLWPSGALGAFEMSLTLIETSSGPVKFSWANQRVRRQACTTICLYHHATGGFDQKMGSLVPYTHMGHARLKYRSGDRLAQPQFQPAHFRVLAAALEQAGGFNPEVTNSLTHPVNGGVAVFLLDQFFRRFLGFFVDLWRVLALLCFAVDVRRDFPKVAPGQAVL